MKGRRPTVALGNAKKFAERQGYIWVPNTNRDIPFDAFVYRGNDMFALRVVTCRNGPGEYDLHKDFFRQDFEILTKLPLPPWLPREVWVRYSWSRAFHRFRLFGNDFLECTMIDREKPVYPCKPEILLSTAERVPEKSPENKPLYGLRLPKGRKPDLTMGSGCQRPEQFLIKRLVFLDKQF